MENSITPDHGLMWQGNTATVVWSILGLNINI